MRTGIWPALTRLRVLWLAAALLLVADIALGPHVRGSSATSLDPVRAQAADPRPAEVVLIGSSRFRRLSPEAISAAAGGVTVVNLSFNGGTFAALDAVIRGCLTPEVLRAGGTRVVLVGSGVMDANDNHTNPVVAGVFWDWGDFFGHLLARGTGAETRSFLFSTPPISWSSLMEAYRRNRLRAALRGALLGHLASRATLETKRAAKSVTGLEQLAPAGTSAYLRRYRTGGRQADALRGIIRYLRGEGVHVVVVHAPVSDWYAGGYRAGEDVLYGELMRRVTGEEGAGLLLFDKGHYGLTDADYFEEGRYDGHHILSERGRRRFAEGIGRAL